MTEPTDNPDPVPPAAPPAESRVNWHYWAAVGCVLAFIWSTLPSLSWRAEPWYETGVNFFAAAYHEPLWDNVWKTDAGYLPWLPRILAVAAVKGFGLVKFYPLAVQLASNLIVALLAAHFCLRPFRAIVANDGVRCLVSIGLGCGLVGNCGHYTMFNTAYMGVPLLLLAACVDLSTLSRKAYAAHLLLVPLLLLSKGMFIAIAPVYGVALLAALARRRGREAVLCVVALVAAAGQAYCLKQSKDKYAETSGQQFAGKGIGYPLAKTKAFVKDLATFYEGAFPFVLLKQPKPDSGGQLAVMMAAVVGGFAAESARRREWRTLALLAAGCVTSLGSSTLLICAVPNGLVTTGFGHPAAVSNNALFIGLMALVGGQLGLGRVAVPLVAALLLAVEARRPEAMHDWCRDFPEQHSQWRLYHHLVDSPDYIIPINCSPWHMSRNSFWLNFEKQLTVNGETGVETGQQIPYSKGWSVRVVMYEQAPEHRLAAQPTTIRAYDADGRQVGTAKRLTPTHLRFQYFLFAEPTKFDRLAFVDDAGGAVKVQCWNLRLYGR